MAGSTPYYGLAFFDFGDELDAPLNVKKEIDRFLVIDKQLYGLYSIFGSGVISGWDVEDGGYSSSTGIAVDVGPGSGIIRYISAESQFTSTITGLPPNSTVNIYAVLTGSTPVDREINFTWSLGELGDFALLLATVVTADLAVSTIDNTVRQMIGFEEIIREEIDAHKHRGTPSKVDLRQETKNQLPGARIEGIDADKITSGVFDINRIPIINHNDLDYSGLLTHPQLDSFVQSLSENNKELLGEISSVNLLKHVLFVKYMYPLIDEHFVNELALIPGISSNDFIDFDNTTAYVDLIEHCISGMPAKIGEFIDIDWDTRDSFGSAQSLTNVIVSGDHVVLDRDQAADDVIESFEGAPGADEPVPGFSKSTEIAVDNLSLTYEAADTLRVDGYYSGKFNPNRTYKSIFTKEFSPSRDWTSYDELVISVKTLAVAHGAVYCYFVNESNGTVKNSSVFLLLAEDEITTNPDSTRNNFEDRKFSIANETKNSVTKFIIFTDTGENFDFYLDDMYVHAESLYAAQGSVNLRYSAGSALTFYSIFYDADIPDGTAVQVRIKSANSTALLSRSSYTPYLASGEVVALSGTDAEIQVVLISNNRTATPTLNSVTLRLLVEAEDHGFPVETSSDWSRGTLDNVEIDPTTGDLANIVMTVPIDVGGWYFSYLQGVREVDDTKAGVFGFDGINMPISPVQAIQWATNPVRGFSDPVSTVRKINKNFLIADRNNDRVLEVDSEGQFVRGFGSVHVSSSVLYPLVSCYNSQNGVLTVVMSKNTDRSSTDVTKISLYLGGTELTLTSSDTLLSNNKSTCIVEIQLSTDKQAQLAANVSDLYVNMLSGTFAEALGSDTNSKALLGARGIEVFQGEFTYTDKIRHPVYLGELSSGNWVVANSTVLDTTTLAKDSSGTTITSSIPVTSVLEFDPDSPNDPVFTFNDILFSDYSLGSIEEYSSTKLLVGGIYSSGSSSTNTSVVQQQPPSNPNTTQITITFENRENGLLKDAVSAVLSSRDGLYGIKRTDNNAIVVAAETALQKVSTGVYQYVFNGQSGIEYTATAKMVIYGSTTPVYSADWVGTANIATDTGTLYERARSELSSYRGTLFVVDKEVGGQVFQYLSPDGLYVSDVGVDGNGYIVAAESAFSGGTGGRIIKLDNYGNIVWLKCDGSFGKINDAKPLEDDHLLVSF